MSKFVESLLKVIEDTITNNVDTFSEHLASELGVKKKKVDKILKTFQWNCDTHIQKKSEKSQKKTRSMSITQKATNAKANDKYYCVEIGRMVGKNKQMKTKYDFYSDLGIAGIADSNKLKKALKELNAKYEAPDPKKKKVNPKQRVQLRQNEYDNYEDRKTGIVFDRKKKVAIGTQNRDTGEVVPLTKDDIKVCRFHKWKYEEQEQDELNQSVICAHLDDQISLSDSESD